MALDVKSRKHHPIYGMGRHNHENSVAIPGYGKPVVLSGDDTFTSGPLTGVPDTPLVPSQSQLYSYIAPNTNDLLADKGDLWAFVSDTPGVTSYYDVIPGSGMSVTGHFIKVPRDIATGLNPDGSEIKAADKGYPPPPNNGTWQTDLRSIAPVGIDGPQWVLQHWSDLNHVFQFVRVEDIAYDKRPGKSNVVYIADSGRGRTDGPEPGHAELQVLERARLEDGARPERPEEGARRSPCSSRATTPPSRRPPRSTSRTTSSRRRNGILVTEDPGSSQQFPRRLGDPNATHGEALAGACRESGRCPGRGQGGPVRRRVPGRDVDGRPTRQLGRLGVDRHRRRLEGVRP